MSARLNAVMIYAKDMQKTADFYQTVFGMFSNGAAEGLIELCSADGEPVILIHQAAKSVKLGQAAMKLVFAVSDVEDFKRRSLLHGVKFGSTHHANGYSFANAKDPDKNSVSISSRAYRIQAAAAGGTSGL